MRRAELAHGLLASKHQPGEVHIPAVRRRVRTVVIAQLALITEVNNFPMVLSTQILNFVALCINRFEQRIE